MAQDEAVPPQLTLLYRMEALLSPPINIEDIPYGQTRSIIPIIGGTFKGPRLSGKILNIGADWLLVDNSGKTRPDTRYVLQTDAGEIIYIQTEGLPPKDNLDSTPNMLRGKFETSRNNTVAWLNDVAAIAVLRVGKPNTVLIDMWEATPAPESSKL
ncbi:hypothetical protein COCCADRAFT_86942 [Bipolaris zeicola 26-R-13]|uniref:Uncharacterized protein n=1 Tax=Cochliobolus carbonum (strain 26-R-13) TaxID=930089 RepID=W6YBS2_COCC2|nr:uncharacterized protein COCCADRAFT_86942 [Bipolaris zeicola 26-R-13]EUC36952.1 hypothetical protein COCCADRAFT_86942 [Bipolaris zeicola 26-R-13]